MDLLELTLPTPAENLALDEALLLEAESGAGEVLRLWEWPAPAVVLGSGCKLAEDVDVAALVGKHSAFHGQCRSSIVLDRDETLALADRYCLTVVARTDPPAAA